MVLSRRSRLTFSSQANDSETRHISFFYCDRPPDAPHNRVLPATSRRKWKSAWCRSASRAVQPGPQSRWTRHAANHQRHRFSLPVCSSPYTWDARVLTPTSRGKEARRALWPTRGLTIIHHMAQRPVGEHSVALGKPAPEQARLPTAASRDGQRASEAAPVGGPPWEQLLANGVHANYHEDLGLSVVLEVGERSMCSARCPLTQGCLVQNAFMAADNERFQPVTKAGFRFQNALGEHEVSVLRGGSRVRMVLSAMLRARNKTGLPRPKLRG